MQASGEYSTGPVSAKQGVMEWVERTEATIANRGKIMGIETGLLELDQSVHGLDDSQGEIVVIAGRPGQGKTAMATTLIHNMAVLRGSAGARLQRGNERRAALRSHHPRRWWGGHQQSYHRHV
jgi:replicative DNA helicase